LRIVASSNRGLWEQTMEVKREREREREREEGETCFREANKREGECLT